LIFGDFDGGGSKRVFFEDPEHQPDCNYYEEVAQYGKLRWNIGPAETPVKPGDDESGDGRESRA
jgi:hypothetical protein